ncbi:MAG: DUF4810 domain-containing protein [Paramuribaculum sp.]|nr:DUF4810 domain-containing protein [Paramuribaculum sp.]
MVTKKKWTIVPMVIALMGITSCSSQKSLYSWYGYEDAAYQNNKKQTEKTEENFVKQISKVMEKQTGTRHIVPPGIFAEYGYFLIKKGKVQEGTAILRKEIETYPESQIFITRIINQVEPSSNETK